MLVNKPQLLYLRYHKHYPLISWADLYLRCVFGSKNAGCFTYKLLPSSMNPSLSLWPPHPPTLTSTLQRVKRVIPLTSARVNKFPFNLASVCHLISVYSLHMMPRENYGHLISRGKHILEPHMLVTSERECSLYSAPPSQVNSSAAPRISTACVTPPCLLQSSSLLARLQYYY